MGFGVWGKWDAARGVRLAAYGVWSSVMQAEE
jgi:hypothetical protein